MAYADGLLTTGERVVHREKQHWWVFVWGARYTIAAIVIAVVFFFLGGNLDPDGVSGNVRMILGWITAILFIGGLAVAFWTALRYVNQEYVLTNRRVIETEGVVKLLADAKTDRLLGAHIVGPRASDLIAELVAVMEFRGSAEDVARTCHAHPTLSETVREAALAVDKRSISA